VEQKVPVTDNSQKHPCMSAWILNFYIAPHDSFTNAHLFAGMQFWRGTRKVRATSVEDYDVLRNTK